MFFLRWIISWRSSFSLTALRHGGKGCGKNSGYLNLTSGETAGSRSWLALGWCCGPDLRLDEHRIEDSTSWNQTFMWEYKFKEITNVNNTAYSRILISQVSRWNLVSDKNELMHTFWNCRIIVERFLKIPVGGDDRTCYTRNKPANKTEQEISFYCSRNKNDFRNFISWLMIPFFMW